MQTHKPEILHELAELVHPLCQRHDDVDERVGHAESFLFDLHDGAKRPKQDKAPEFMLVVPFERELVQSAFTLFCAVDPC